MMPLNVQKCHQVYTLPPGWSTPKFSFGQIVRCDFPETYFLESRIAWGEIVEMGFFDGNWFYGVLISPDCPLAIKHPQTWGDGVVETFFANQLTLRNSTLED